jgi:hypothetical protein
VATARGSRGLTGAEAGWYSVFLADGAPAPVGPTGGWAWAGERRARSTSPLGLSLVGWAGPYQPSPRKVADSGGPALCWRPTGLEGGSLVAP